jgi:Tol biopolymer transport system component
MSISRGTRFGSYEIVEPIGSGGMGEVYRARDTTLGRDVALKVLPASFSYDAMRVARFEQEAKTLASLNHANIAHIYGLERSEGSTGIAMELVDGETLVDRIAQGPIPVTEAMRIANQIADALEAAHERAIVHRDLKPANVKIKPDGTVKVLDFGIAKALDPRFITGPGPAALTTPAATEAGFILGTAAYMSPEQARGKFVDQRTDIWAFGCVLYEMLTGKPAFLGEDVTSTLARVLEVGANLRALPTGVPPAVRRTLELCLEKDARKRIADMRDVKLALAGVFATPTLARQEPLWRRALPVAAALVIGAIAAGVYFASMRSRPEPVSQVPAPQVPVPQVGRFVVTTPASAPLANLSGFDVAISPDGKRFVYFAENAAAGTVALYVREIDGLEPRLIKGTEVDIGNGALNPFFSPDGESVGLFSPGRGVIRVSIDGGPPLKIVDSPSPAFVGGSWTNDDTLIYSSGLQLFRVPTGGGMPEPLTKVSESGAVVTNPVPLPGGRAVLYSEVKGESERELVLDLDTGEQKVVLDGAQNATYSPTGHLVFARGTTLMAVPFDAKELAVQGEPVAIVQGVRHPNVLNAADFALSASGTLVYVPGGGESASLSTVVWVDRAGQVVGRAVGDLVDRPRDPALSPDGARLALTTGSNSDAEIWSYDLRGRPPIRIAVRARGPVWNPDGKRIAFAEALVGGKVFTMLADGSTLTPESTESFPGMPRSWSAAGDLVLVRAPLPAGDIFAMPAGGGGEPHPVVATEYAETDPMLSPDGRWLAYVSNRTGRPEIWVQGYPKGVPTRVSNNGGYEPRWAADGTELFYLQANAMMAAKVQPGAEITFDKPVQLFEGRFFTNPAPATSSYDVARDGRFLMIQPSGSDEPPTTNIVVVQNFSEELKRRVPHK